MNRKHSSIVNPVKKDDAYWSALFLQDELKITPRIVEENELISHPLTNPNGSTSETNDSWQLAQEMMIADRSLRLQVSGYNKGGLLVTWRELQGFVPASQLLDFPFLHVARERLRVLAGLQGKTLTLKIIEVNSGKNRLVLSERAAQVRASQRIDTLNRVRSGSIMRGRVTNLTDFGAFVDLGGLEGLVHISELSWSRVTHPSHVLQAGQEIDILVLTVDHERERVALSYKRLKPDPWQTACERYNPGDIVSGVVSNITNFGAFILLEEELEGLIHVSEMGEDASFHPRGMMKIGKKIQARVLYVNSQEKRLALSLRGLNKT